MRGGTLASCSRSPATAVAQAAPPARRFQPAGTLAGAGFGRRHRHDAAVRGRPPARLRFHPRFRLRLSAPRAAARASGQFRAALPPARARAGQCAGDQAHRRERRECLVAPQGRLCPAGRMADDPHPPPPDRVRLGPDARTARCAAPRRSSSSSRQDRAAGAAGSRSTIWRSCRSPSRPPCRRRSWPGPMPGVARRRRWTAIALPIGRRRRVPRSISISAMPANSAGSCCAGGRRPSAARLRCVACPWTAAPGARPWRCAAATAASTGCACRRARRATSVSVRCTPARGMRLRSARSRCARSPSAPATMRSSPPSPPRSRAWHLSARLRRASRITGHWSRRRTAARAA